VHFTTEYARQSDGDAHLFDFCFSPASEAFCHSLSSAPDSWTLQTQLESLSLSFGSHSNPTL
jgi:hypothetical protein